MACPEDVSSGPPLFPGLVAASVWITFEGTVLGIPDGADDPRGCGPTKPFGIAEENDPLALADGV